MMHEGVMMRRLRWFAAELIVVIVGILIALALQSWWGNRNNAARERMYLEQLLEDTRENERLLSLRIRADSTGRERSLHMAALLRDRRPLPPLDSLVAWSRMATASISFVAGTYDAMVGTGDLRIIRNPELRSATLSIANQLKRAETSVGLNAESQKAYVQQRTISMLRHLKAPGVPEAGNPDPLDIAWWSRVDYRSMQGDPDAIAAFQLSVYTLNNSLGIMRTFRTSLAAYRVRLEQELSGG